MIDGIKLYYKNLEYAEKLKNNPLFEFESTVNNTTGEYKNSIQAKHKNIDVKIYESGTVIINGSFHKYYNNGKHNFNDFPLSAIIQTIQQYCELFGNEILNSKIDNLEFGVNITPPIKTAEVLRNLIFHQRAEFKKGTFINSDYREATHTNYYFKVYDKSKQYYQNRDILRVELKYIKMAELNKLGIDIFSDLLKPEIYPNLCAILNDKWSEVLFIDETIKTPQLSEKQQRELINWQNPIYWQKLAANKNKSYQFNKEFNKYSNVLNKFSETIKKQVQDLITEKWQKLTDISEPIKINLAKNNYLYIGLNFANSVKRCQVTGFPIDIQKKNSKFLNISGIKYLYNNHNEIFKNNLLPRLSEKWINEPLKIQFREIAHSIRNEYFNKKHNCRKSINKVLKMPSLFDNIKLIKPEKLKQAGLL